MPSLFISASVYSLLSHKSLCYNWLPSITTGEGQPGRILHWRDKDGSLPDGGALQRPADRHPPEAPLYDAGGLPGQSRGTEVTAHSIILQVVTPFVHFLCLSSLRNGLNSTLPSPLPLCLYKKKWYWLSCTTKSPQKLNHLTVGHSHCLYSKSVIITYSFHAPLASPVY